MKKLLLLTCVLLLSFGGALFAQEVTTQQEVSPNNEIQAYKDYPWSLGASFEVDQNARENVATGYGISIDRFLGTPLVALGIRGNMYTDGAELSATEVLLHVRAYLPLTNNAAVSASLFAQLGLGASFYTDEEREMNTYTMDFIAGSRIYLLKSGFLRGFYVEPYVRVGFPFLFSGGVAVGHWFNF